MLQQVISLSSSDEEDISEPPPKKKKLLPPIIPQVTLTLVPNVKKKIDPIETVSLDSDEEMDQPSESQRKASSGNKGSVDLITVSDDEVDVPVQFSDEIELIKKNKITTEINNSNMCVNETVSIIDSDSDNETIGDGQVKVAEEKTKELTDTNENMGTTDTIQEADDTAVTNTTEIGEKTIENIDDEQVKIAEEKTKESTDTNENMVTMETVQETDDKAVTKTDEKNIENNDTENKEDNENNTSEPANVKEVANDKDINEAGKDNNETIETANDKDISKEGTTDEAIVIIEEATNDIDLSDTNDNTNSLDGEKNDGVPPEEDKSEKISRLASRVEIVESINDSIVIDDSDEEMEKENHCENVDIEPFPVGMDKTSASDIPGPSECLKGESVEASRAAFRKFLKMVEEKIVDSSFEEILPKKVPIIQKYFKKSGPYVNEKVFEMLLNESTQSIRKAPNSHAANTAVLAFHKIFEHLKSHVAETVVDIEEDHLPKVRKLEKTLKLLRKRIKQLEETEVNFDDDEDSAYIMLDRYQARLKKVYAKYCEYIRRNPFSGRALYDKISFVNSKYNEINQAISKKYKNSVNFPSYYELEKYIEKISKKEKLDLSEQEVKYESKKCFKFLGNLLQKKRRQELYDSHLDFVEFSEDPATKDISLENILRKNYSEGKEKIDKLYQKYVNKQEQGEDHVSSDEADSSVSSDAEENDKKSGKKSSKNVKKTDTGKGKGSIKSKKKKEETHENGIEESSDKVEDKKDEPKVADFELNECTVDINRVDEQEALPTDAGTNEKLKENDIET